MTTLMLIRHGETAWNADGRFQGQCDTPLNATGRAQAAQAARALAHHQFDNIYTSDLARAAETARIIAAPHGMQPIADTRLREAFFGDWEGLTAAEIDARWPDILAAWRADALRTRPTGGETLEQVQARMLDFLQDALTRHPEGNVGIIGHGGSLRAIIAHALGIDLTVFRHIRLDNCSISVATLTETRSVLVRLNDICHLDDAPRQP